MIPPKVRLSIVLSNNDLNLPKPRAKASGQDGRAAQPNSEGWSRSANASPAEAGVHPCHGYPEFTEQVQHRRMVLRWDEGTNSLAWPSGLRFAVCEQTANLCARSRGRWIAARRRSVGNCGATPRRGGRGAVAMIPARAQRLADRRRRWDCRFK